MPGFRDRGIEGLRGLTDLLLMVQALVVILQSQTALLLLRVVLAVGVDDVAAEEFLPVGEAPRWA